jgi:alpha-N-arabinofuranosidase
VDRGLNLWGILFVAFCLAFLSGCDSLKLPELNLNIGNPVENASFEKAKESNPDGWSKQNWGGRGSFEYSQIGHKGKRSVMISSENGADISWMQKVPVEPFTRYKLSGWIKTEGVVATTGKGALLNVHDVQSARTGAISGTQDWTLVECEFDAGGNEDIQVNCLFGGWGLAMGRAWYDDIKLEKLKTAKPVSRKFQASVSIDAGKTSEPISPYIYGQFIEHLGRCIYGGIWAEMLEDRKFYYPVPAEGDIWSLTNEKARILAASPWKVLGPKGCVQMIKQGAYVGEHSVEITAAGDGVKAGIYQQELGLVKNQEYAGRAVLAGDEGAGPVEVSLIWGDGEKKRETISIEKVDGMFRKYVFGFTSGANTDNGQLEIAATGTGKLRVGTVSLMPADNINGFRRDTMELLKQLDSPVYRWPGGNFVSGYNWRDGIGDVDKRPPRKNPAWTGVEHNDMGIHEFIEFCRLLDTEPYVTVNTGLGDIEQAAEQVEYCNALFDTPMGKLRTDNGYPESFNVKYWAVGNEMYGSWQLGHMPLEDYTKKHNAVVEAMRKADPTIVCVGVGAVGSWTEGMMRDCAGHMELISEHFYCNNRGNIVQHVRQIPNAIKRIADAHRRYRETIPALKDKDIRIALDEWNYWYGPHVFGELGTRYFVKDGLGVAAGLHEYFRNSDIMFMANYAQTVNVIGCIKTNKTSASFETTGLALMLYRKHYGSIPVEVSGPGGPVDVAAAWTEDRKALTVGVVNPTWDKYSIELQTAGVAPAGEGKVWMIAHKNPLAFNDPGEKPKVRIEEKKVGPMDDGLEIKPLSINVYRFDME